MVEVDVNKINQGVIDKIWGLGGGWLGDISPRWLIGTHVQYNTISIGFRIRRLYFMSRITMRMMMMMKYINRS